MIKDALSYLAHLAAKHRAEGNSSKTIIIGQDLFDSAVAELDETDDLRKILLDGITFVVIGSEVPLSERGFGV